MNGPDEITVRLVNSLSQDELERRCRDLGFSSNEYKCLSEKLSVRLVEIRGLKDPRSIKRAAAGLNLVLAVAPAEKALFNVLLAATKVQVGELAARLEKDSEGEVGGLALQLRHIGLKDKAGHWSLKDREIDLAISPLVMGILNVTPDSFYDGGRYNVSSAAIERASRMLDQGAAIVDVGGESTRPGAEPVSEEEESGRVLPVIRGILERHPQAVVSVDTSKAGVAAQAVAAGASIINDVSAGLTDPAMLDTVASSGAAFVAMHMRGNPRTMQMNTGYDDLTGEIYGYFEERLEAARQAGVARDKIALDPGIGFGKTCEANYRLISRLGEFLPLGCPLLVGPSRKSFLGGENKEDRLEGTLAALTVAILAGASIVRVHDVAEAVRTVNVAARFEPPGL